MHIDLTAVAHHCLFKVRSACNQKYKRQQPQLAGKQKCIEPIVCSGHSKLLFAAKKQRGPQDKSKCAQWKQTFRCFWPFPSLCNDVPNRLQAPSCADSSTAPQPSPNKMQVAASSRYLVSLPRNMLLF